MCVWCRGRALSTKFSKTICLLLPFPVNSCFFNSFSTYYFWLKVISLSHYKRLKDICRAGPGGSLSDCGDVVNVRVDMLHKSSLSLWFSNCLPFSPDESTADVRWQVLIPGHGTATGTGRACGLVVWDLWVFCLLSLKHEKSRQAPAPTTGERERERELGFCALLRCSTFYRLTVVLKAG